MWKTIPRGDVCEQGRGGSLQYPTSLVLSHHLQLTGFLSCASSHQRHCCQRPELSRILRLHSDLEENLKFISDIIISIFLLLAEIYRLLTLSRRWTHFTKYEPDNHHYHPITEGVEVKQPAGAACLELDSTSTAGVSAAQSTL